MPTPTPLTPPALFRPAIADWRLPAASAAFAAAEIALALTVGRLFDSGRAESLIFLALRPWLLVVLAAAVSGWRLRSRAAAYGFALALAGTSEAILLIGLGALDPWPEAARGAAAGALLAAPIDLALQLGRRLARRAGTLVAALAAAALMLLPWGLRPYEYVVLPRWEAKEAPVKPPLLLMTALPIVWGERGAFDPAARPAHSFRALESEFAVRPIDAIDRTTLAGGRALLLAQPRALAPRELVALDEWVRGGGRALILTDPALIWPSALPAFDPRRPPRSGLLGPLLDHWGLSLRSGVTDQRASLRWDRQWLGVDAPGRFNDVRGDCVLERGRLVARCRIGRGRAILIADADLMHDLAWAPLGPERHARTADNPLIVADLIDSLIGVQRPRLAGPVAWIDRSADRSRALILAAIPIAFTLLAAAILSTNLSTARSNKNKHRSTPRTEQE